MSSRRRRSSSTFNIPDSGKNFKNIRLTGFDEAWATCNKKVMFMIIVMVTVMVMFMVKVRVQVHGQFQVQSRSQV